MTISKAEQMGRLAKVMDALKDDYGAFLYLEDATLSFIVPIVPEYRDIHIVAPIADAGDHKIYDIWRGYEEMIEANLALDDVVGWLRDRITRSDEEFAAHIAQWAEDTVRMYLPYMPEEANA